MEHVEMIVEYLTDGQTSNIMTTTERLFAVRIVLYMEHMNVT